jgi:hypothetical protein
VNDDIIVVTAYPNTPAKIDVLKRCLLQLKKTNKEILLCSHYPANEDILSLVNYYVYDSRNEIISKEEYVQYIDKDSSYYYSDADAFIFYIRNLYDYYHYFAIYQLFEVAFKYVNVLGKKYCHLLEGDVIVQDDDLGQFDVIKNRVVNNNKKAYFQFNGDFAAYSVTYFFIDVEFFLSNFQFIKTKKEYIERYKSRMFIEAAVTSELEPVKGLIDIDEWGCHFKYLNAFPNSKDSTNLSHIATGTMNDMQFSGLAHSNGKWYLYSTSHWNSILTYECELTRNGEQISKFNYSVPHHNYYYQVFDLDYSDGSSYNLLLKFTCDEKEYTALNLIINKETEPILEKIYDIKWK